MIDFNRVQKKDAGLHKIYNERSNVVYFLYYISDKVIFKNRSKFNELIQCVNVYVVFGLFVLRNNISVHYVCLGSDDI